MDEAPNLMSPYERQDAIQNVVGLRWLYAITKAPLAAHPWGTYEKFLDRLHKQEPAIVRKLRDVDVSAFLEAMMGSTADSLAFLCVDEAYKLGNSKVRSADTCSP